MDYYDDYNCDESDDSISSREDGWAETQKFLAQTISTWSERYDRVCQRLESVQKEYQSWMQDSREALKKAHAERNDALKEVADLKSYWVVIKTKEYRDALDDKERGWFDKFSAVSRNYSDSQFQNAKLQKQVRELTEEIEKLKNS